jgi:hypothetical protein
MQFIVELPLISTALELDDIIVSMSFVVFRGGEICGAKIVPFVGNKWKKYPTETIACPCGKCIWKG